MSDLRYQTPVAEAQAEEAPQLPNGDAIGQVVEAELPPEPPPSLSVDLVLSEGSPAVEMALEAPQPDGANVEAPEPAIVDLVAAAVPEPPKAPPRPQEPHRVLEVQEFSVLRKGAERPELDRISLAVKSGETIVLFGEQGCGKETFLRALAGALERNETTSGMLRLGSGDADAATVRMAYLPGPFLQPLSPHASAASQLARAIMRKLAIPESAAREELRLALARFERAPSLERLAGRPASLSHETLAWALLAAAMAQTPDLLMVEHLVADLPLMQARGLIEALLSEQKRLGFAIVYSARGAHVLNWLGGRVVVLRQGRIVEEGSAERLASGAAHAYTQTLFRGLPRLTSGAPPRNTPRGEPMLHVRGLELAKTEKSDRLLSREGLTFELRRGAALALIGEEGSGRRRLARTLIGLERPGAGRIVLDAVDIGILSETMLQRMRRRVAFIVGTDDVLDDRMTVWDTVAEPLEAHLHPTRDVVAIQTEGALKRVGLAAGARRVTVAELSTFDRRRLQVARAIVTQPHIAIIDEPLRGLDAFGQGVIRDLLKEFRRQEGPAFLVITADFSVADAFTEEAFVFQGGRVIERGSMAQLLKRPIESETRRLIAAVTAAALSPATA